MPSLLYIYYFNMLLFFNQPLFRDKVMNFLL